MFKTINKAYQIFSRYKLKEEIDVCTYCCVTAEEKQKLETLALSEIPHELIYIHNTAATSIKPPIEEFKYFLPRYLELIAETKFPSHSIELSLKRIKHYETQEFTDEEIQIIHEFCSKFFEQTLANYPIPDDDHIDAVLVMLYDAKCDMNDILKIWSNDQSKSGNRHFTDFVNHCLNKRRNTINNPFSNKLLDQIIEDWLDNNELYKTKYEQL